MFNFSADIIFFKIKYCHKVVYFDSSVVKYERLSNLSKSYRNLSVSRFIAWLDCFQKTINVVTFIEIRQFNSTPQFLLKTRRKSRGNLHASQRIVVASGWGGKKKKERAKFTAG